MEARDDARCLVLNCKGLDAHGNCPMGYERSCMAKAQAAVAVDRLEEALRPDGGIVVGGAWFWLPPEVHEFLFAAVGEVRAEVARLQEQLRGEQSSPVNAESDCYCGYLGWTVEKYGRVTHKCGCPARTDPWCQSHPDACPIEPKGLDTRSRATQATAEQSHSDSEPCAVCVRLQDALRRVQAVAVMAQAERHVTTDTRLRWLNEIENDARAALRVFEEDAPETESSEAPLSGRGEEQT